jgi:hypothetical protein
MRYRRFALMAGTALAGVLASVPALADPVTIGIAAFGAYAAAAGTAVATGVAISAALISTSAIVAGVIGGVMAAASQLLVPQPSLGGSALNQQVSSQQAGEPRRIIYGRTRVGPWLPYHAVTDENGKDRNLHLVHVLAAHECDGLEEIWFDDEQVWNPVEGWGSFNDEAFNGRADFTFHPGTEDQEADADLVAKTEDWTAAHRGRGIAWVYLHLVGASDLFPRGVPSVTYVVRGARVFDPRTGLTAWSDNPALVINDWVLSSRYGYRERAKFWDEASVIAAANICDEPVALAEGGTEKRYTFGGAFTADVDKEDALRGMLTTCAGMVPREGPRRRLLAGAYRTPVVELTDEDLAGKVDITAGKPRRQTFTAVRGRFQSPQANYILDDYPEVVSEAHDPATGDPKYHSLDLPFTPSPATAQRLAKLTLLAQAERITASASWKLKALRLRAGDTFLWTSERYGWVQKVFEVTDRALVVEGDPPRMSVSLTCRETGPQVHDWTISDQTPYLAGTPTQLGNPFTADPPGLAIADALRVIAQQVVTVLLVTPATSSNNASGFEVQARRQGDTTPINMGRGQSGVFELPFVGDGEAYEVRARVITIAGGASPWTAWTPYTVIGKAAPPSDVTGFRMEAIGAVAHLSWDPVPDPDLSHYRVRHSTLTAGAGFEAALDVAARVARPATSVSVPLQPGTYLIVAYDKSGNRSASANAIVTTVSAVAGLNAVETVSEAAPFPGTHDRTIELGGALLLDRMPQAPFMDGIADIGAVTDWSAIGAGDTWPDGRYRLAGTVDLGAVYTSRLSAAVTMARFEKGVGVDGVRDVSALEDWSQVGASLTRRDDVNAWLELRSTPDDPGGAPAWSAWMALRAGDYRARAYQFRLVLTTDNPEASPSVTGVTIHVDMPDRIAAGQDISSGAGPKAIGFIPAFRALTSVGVTAQDMGSGDYWEITGKSASGFTITFRNAAGTPVDRIFDYQALGYGEAA